MNKVTVIGAGLAGCEAAYALANEGIKVCLCEQKPNRRSAAHHTDLFAELVCSNSLKADRISSAGGLLKSEMRRFGSLCLESADLNRVPAGGALAVERYGFAEYITEKIKSHKNIEIAYGEITQIPKGGTVIIASGPLTSDALFESIRRICGDSLSFYDAAAPIVTAESLDKDECFSQSRYERGNEDDYINCPLNKEQYEAFYSQLVNAERVIVKEFEKGAVYEGCMPIEVLASRGADTMRFGPMKPVGLRDPKTGHRPWAVVQLRKENKEGTMYNLVGFQTNLKFGEQKRVFSMIPALKNAEFVRYGVMHRNTFINSPKLLDGTFSLKSDRRILFAGQITGVEGYMESAMSGIVAANTVIRRFAGKEEMVLPPETMIGALCRYISDEYITDFQPMGASFGLLPMAEIKIRDKKERYEYLAKRSLAVYDRLGMKEKEGRI